MQRKLKTTLAVGAAATALLAVGGGIAVAGGADDDDAEKEVPIEGSDLDNASRAALDHTGEGRVTDTEVGDEESYYEVEVTLDDGSQVDVQLDESFAVVGSESDDESEDEGGGADD